MNNASLHRTVFATGQSVRPRPGPGRTTLCPPPWSPADFRCFPLSPSVPRRPPPPPAVPQRHLPSPTRNCLTSWGSSSFIMTAVLQVPRRGGTELCRPVSSGALGSPPVWPYRGPRRCEHWHRMILIAFELGRSFTLRYPSPAGAIVPRDQNPLQNGNYLYYIDTRLVQEVQTLGL